MPATSSACSHCRGQPFDQVGLTLGYPARGDHPRRLALPWRGYTVKTISHRHFGREPVEVFAIDVKDTP